jgi:outer membrane receptor for ferrienterochelin and colicins
LARWRPLARGVTGVAALAFAYPCLAAAESVQADPASATVRGVVVDAATGAPVAGAELVLDGSPADHTGRADAGADGQWRMAGVPSGSYRLTVSRLGYEHRTLDVDVPAPGGARAAVIRVELVARALPLDALVVTASRKLQRLADAPVAIEVVRAEDLRRTGASDLASVLTERTGIQLQGGHPNGAGVMLHGLDSERVLVLVDGQPWVGRLSGTADLSRIPVSVVERVEVVKGPQATLYGSEAMGGVVNIITRRPDGAWGGSLAAASGSQARLDTSARLTGQHDHLGFTLDLGRRAEDLVPGQSTAPAGETGAGATVRRHDGHARLTWASAPELSAAMGDPPASGGARGGTSGDAGSERRGRAGAPSFSLEAAALFVDEEQRWRSGQLRHFGDNRQSAVTLEGRWSGATHRLTTVLHASRFDHLLRRGTRDVPPPESAGDRQIQSLSELDLQWGWTPERARGLALDAGVEASRESIEAETVDRGERERTTVEPYAQATLKLGSTALVPGLRFSHSTRWGAHWTPRLALMTRPLPELALRASVSTGYRAPGFKELWLDFLNSGPGFGYVVRGNPDLEPETSVNLSAGVEWIGLDTYVRAQAFHNRFDGFIETRALADSAGLTVYTYGNIAEGRTAGVELETGWNVGPFDTELGYAWLTTEDAGTGEPLLGRPEHSARASLGIPLAGFRTHVALTWTGTTPLTRDAETGATLDRDGFARVDARVARRIYDRIELALGADNVFDTTPSAWPGFAGRRMHLTVTTTLFGATHP